MTQYELMYILPAKFEEQEQQVVIKRVSDLMTSLDATIKDHSVWLTRKLSYPIKHIRQGVFILSHFSIPAEGLKKLKRELELDEDIIRHLIVTVDQSVKTQAALRRPQVLPQQSVLPKQEESTDPVSSPEKEQEKVSLEELDQKLEELLGDESSIK